MTRQFRDYSDILHHHTLKRGDAVALRYGNESVTYSLLQENVNRFGNMVKSLGVRDRDRIVVALPDCPDAFYAFLGAMKSGVRPILLGSDMSVNGYEYVLRDAAPSAVITIGSSNAVEAGARASITTICIDERNYAGLMKKVSPFLAPSPPSEDGFDFLLYSSGSTGGSKGVPHSQGDMMFCAEQYAGKVLNMTDEDVVLSASKLHFAYGLGNSLIFPLYFGASTILTPRVSGPADVLWTFQLIAELRPTLFFSVPTLYNLMVKTMGKRLSFPSLRLCVSAGEPLPAGVYRAWQRLTGLEILDGIGSTEALHIYISNPPGDTIPGKTGCLVPGYEAEIIDEDGAPLRSGQPGTLLIRGESTAPSYWNRPGATERTMLGDGWLNTGDVFVEENGWYNFLGRVDDMFKCCGSWVSPVAVEEVLREHPAVLECAVTSREVEGLLKPIAHIVLKSGYGNKAGLSFEMRSLVRHRLPANMCPDRFNFTESLPKTETGKIRRSVLRRESA